MLARSMSATASIQGLQAAGQCTGLAPHAGINSRALHTLFEVAGAGGRRRPVSLNVAFLEVYNEAVRDLLVRDSGALEVSGIPAGQLPEGTTAALVL